MAGLFDYVNRLTKKKSIDESLEQFEKDFSPWMINRFMSCDKQLVHLANAANQEHMTKKMVFDFYDHAIPKTNKFIRYSAKKAKGEKYLQYVMEWYNCNLSTAKQYLELISKDELDNIIHHFEKERIGRKK